MEDRLAAIESRIDAILPTLATKADVAEVRADITKWMLGTMLAIIGTSLAAIIGLGQMLKGSQPAPQQPTVIVVPAQK